MDELLLEGTTVEEVMHVGVTTCGLHTPLTSLARTMATNRIHCVIVWNEPSRNEAAELWGVVSDLDLMKVAVAQDLATATAGRSAATPAMTIAPKRTLADAARLMAEHDVAHLVVVEPETERPLGVLSTLDVARVLGGVAEPTLV